MGWRLVLFFYSHARDKIVPGDSMKNAQTFSLHPDQYAASRPQYPRELFAFLAAAAPERARAWDCATGNGQAAVSYAEYFSQVQATDISPEQLRHADARPKIHYSVCPAERTPFANRAFDLIGVAQAIHWFDQPRFFQETERLLKPGGILAVWGYSHMFITPEADALIAEKLDPLINPFWASGNRQLMDGYPDLRLPFDPIEPPRDLAIQIAWTLPQLLDYIRTWSAVKRYAEKFGSDPVTAVEPGLQTAWQNPDQPRLIRIPLIFKASRKPA
ncbi:MAG: class I SAM-dependent methyltransferase [Chloroflexi bacterium CFX1]|nr:class I SAM-dependent methyltransferase [Chloroflexi bacterium CFX1]MCQ3952527.1 SAM-dependent methyltransferase [Chloroflexota bacterium]